MPIEALTAELAWIRRLARVLVRDASAADDVAQETWLAAAGKLPDDRPLRPWLARVVHNVVRMRVRASRRRTVREAAAPAGEAPLGADQLIDRVELQRSIVDEVLALHEPYRSTVLLHFFEGLTSADIARRLGVPDGTVRRRLKVAVDELRRRLGERHQRRGGVLALAPLCGLSPVESSLYAGGITMKKLVLALAALVIAVGTVWWWQGRAAKRPAAAAATAAGGAVAGKAGDVRTPDSRGAADGPAAPAPWFVQAGVDRRRIAGRVSFQGQPVAGAVVRLGGAIGDRPDPGDDRSGDELAQATTGADGRFDFGLQPAATFVVSADASDRTPASRLVAAADPTSKAEAIELELGPCRSRLFGQVVDASGGGVARARLRVVGLGGADADATGHYALCVPVGDSRIRVDADGYGAIDRPLHLVGELREDFELVPEAILVGRVVDEQGDGVPFARVVAVPQAIEEPHFLGDGHAVADARGGFRIGNLAPGRFLLSATADGHGTPTARPAIAAPGASAAEITIVVSRRARVTGTVMAAGKPVAGAQVLVSGADLSRRASYSQPDGGFILDGVPPGPQALRVIGYQVLSPKQLVVKGTALDGVVVEVEAQPALIGRVLRHGKGVAGAVVQTSLGPSTTSDRDGAYQLRGLPAGELQVTAQAYGAVNAFAPFAKVKLAAGEVTEHDILLTGGAEVHGVVVDAQGAPVPNVYVRMIEPRGDLGESMTDARGAFACTSMLGGAAYRVAVFPSPGARTAFAPLAGAPLEIPVADGDTIVENVRVAIAHDVMSISGRVVDDAGQPVADVHVEAVGRGFGGFAFAPLPSVRADADGRFTIGDLARGTYMLHARAGDGSEAELIDVPAGKADVTLELVRPGTIEGTLVGFATVPRVHARQLTAALQLDNDAVVDGDHFSITGLAPGRYVVEALAGEQSAGQSIEVRSGAVTRVKLEGQGKGRVAGTVTDFKTRAPVAGFTCVAAQSMGGQAGDWPQVPATPENTTDARGAFDIPAPLGQARVMCFPSDGTYSVAGGDAEVTARGGARVELKTVKREPPPSDPGFRIKPLTLPLVIAMVDADGPARAAGLAVGDIVVTIDGRPVAGLLPGGAMALVWNTRAGSRLVLGVERAGAPKTIEIVPVAPTN